jgi:hypothetical protein
MRRRPDHRTLCAIARTVIEADPSMCDAEWKEEIKQRLIAQGWDYPERPDQIGAAMTAIEHALVRKWGPRPALRECRKEPDR